MRDPDTGASKGFGFCSYDNFESSDAAIEAMNGQYLCNRPIHVSYALKKDTKGERHGSQAGKRRRKRKRKRRRIKGKKKNRKKKRRKKRKR
jgi:splicing factor 3B subunit 4